MRWKKISPEDRDLFKSSFNIINLTKNQITLAEQVIFLVYRL